MIIDNILELRRKQEGEYVILSISGHLTNDTINKFNNYCQDIMSFGHCKVILDMTELQILSSVGIREIINFSNSLEKTEGGGLRLYNLPPQIKTIVKVVGLFELFKPYSSLDEAKGSF